MCQPPLASPPADCLYLYAGGGAGGGGQAVGTDGGQGIHIWIDTCTCSAWKVTTPPPPPRLPPVYLIPPRPTSRRGGVQGGGGLWLGVRVSWSAPPPSSPQWGWGCLGVRRWKKLRTILHPPPLPPSFCEPGRAYLLQPPPPPPPPPRLVARPLLCYSPN